MCIIVIQSEFFLFVYMGAFPMTHNVENCFIFSYNTYRVLFITDVWRLEKQKSASYFISLVFHQN